MEAEGRSWLQAGTIGAYLRVRRPGAAQCSASRARKEGALHMKHTNIGIRLAVLVAAIALIAPMNLSGDDGNLPAAGRTRARRTSLHRHPTALEPARSAGASAGPVQVHEHQLVGLHGADRVSDGCDELRERRQGTWVVPSVTAGRATPTPPTGSVSTGIPAPPSSRSAPSRTGSAERPTTPPGGRCIRVPRSRSLAVDTPRRRHAK